MASELIMLMIAMVTPKQVMRSPRGLGRAAHGEA
jgi:hypothetical protein